MAVYDGFFDAVADEETGKFDREYGSGDFTDYFAHIIGSGVCIHNNPDSYKAEFEDGTLYLRPGYLFIQGYWLANKPGPDEDPATYKGYAVALPAGQTGPLAIVAHLNLGKRMIELEAQSLSQSYPDSLVLALVNPAAGTADDTRHNVGICGIIDTAGELSKKVEWAVNYIDNEIEDRLHQIEADIAAQERELDAKIAQVQAVADSIVPPPVGTIKFSASQNVGEEWLKCDGSFVSEKNYPELVAALGKLVPSGDKFQLISDGEIGENISNGVLYGGRLWVYSYSSKKLYGVDVEGKEAIKEITVTSENEHFSSFIPQNTAKPLCLSIVLHKIGTGAKIFLSQWLDDIEENKAVLSSFLLFQSEFTGAEASISVAPAFTSITGGYDTISQDIFLPYVDSMVESGIERYLCPCYRYESPSYFLCLFSFYDNECALKSYSSNINRADSQWSGFSSKSNGECVEVDYNHSSASWYSYSVKSVPNEIFSNSGHGHATFSAGSKMAMNIIGRKKVIAGFTVQELPWFSVVESDSAVASHGISLPDSARIFVDAGAYLWGKDIYMIFVGTGIIFSRTLEEGSFGYLDTTSVLGTITRFGYLDYSQDEGTLYLMGQDTTNTVKVAKIVLNTLYDYANDGAWLPMIASDGVPAYIKAYEPEGAKR